MKKSFLFISYLCLFACVSCSSDDEEWNYTPNDLYAVIVPEGEQLISITPSDYVLTLDNIIAANSETGEFKLQNTDRIDSKAFPIPTQVSVKVFIDNYDYIIDFPHLVSNRHSEMSMLNRAVLFVPFDAI